MSLMEPREIDTEGTRPALTEGIFYPSDGKELQDLTGRLLEEAEALTGPDSQPSIGSGSGSPGPAPRNAAGTVIPHASYDIVGRSIAAGLLPLRNRTAPRRIISVAPVHREPFDGCVLPGFRAFRSPLGTAAVDEAAVARIIEDSRNRTSAETGIRLDSTPFLEEHALELALPFLQRLSGETPVVPVLIGNNSAASLRALRRILTLLTGDDPFLEEHYLLVSSNLTGYVDRSRAASQRDRFLELMRGGDARELTQSLSHTHISACGAAACAAVMQHGHLRARLVEEPYYQQPERGGRLVYYGTLLLERISAASEDTRPMQIDDTHDGGPHEL
jgi:hypothetical protein